MKIGGLYDAVFDEVSPAYLLDDEAMVESRTTRMKTPYQAQKYAVATAQSSKNGPVRATLGVRVEDINANLVVSLADVAGDVRIGVSGFCAVGGNTIPSPDFAVAADVWIELRYTFDWDARTYTIGLDDNAARMYTMTGARSISSLTAGPLRGEAWVDDLSFPCAAVPPAVAPSACHSHTAAATVVIAAGSVPLIGGDRVAIVPGDATDCTTADASCDADSLACHPTRGALTLIAGNLEWDLPAGDFVGAVASTTYRVCHKSEPNSNWQLVNGALTTCAAAATTCADAPAPVDNAQSLAGCAGTDVGMECTGAACSDGFTKTGTVRCTAEGAWESTMACNAAAGTSAAGSGWASLE